MSPTTDNLYLSSAVSTIPLASLLWLSAALSFLAAISVTPSSFYLLQNMAGNPYPVTQLIAHPHKRKSSLLTCECKFAEPRLKQMLCSNEFDDEDLFNRWNTRQELTRFPEHDVKQENVQGKDMTQQRVLKLSRGLPLINLMNARLLSQFSADTKKSCSFKT